MREQGWAIEAKNLGYRDENGRVLLEGLTFNVPAGQKVAILGASGAGKSLLLALLNGMLPASGQVKVQGLPLPGTAVAKLRRAVGLVFQESRDQLFSTSVYENVAMGLRGPGKKEAEVRGETMAMLKMLDLEEDAQRAPMSLGGGETKRVAIAAELARKPAILCLDEPCAGLDHGCSLKLQSLLAGYGGSLLLATHDLNLAAKLTERALVLNQGRLGADLNPRLLVEDEGLQYSLGLI